MLIRDLKAITLNENVSSERSIFISFLVYMSNFHAADFLAMCHYLVPFASFFFFNLFVTYFVVTSIISPQFACYFHLYFILNFDGHRYFVVFSFYFLLASFFSYLFGRTFLTLHFNIKILLRFLLGVFYIGPTAYTPFSKYSLYIFIFVFKCFE